MKIIISISIMLLYLSSCQSQISLTKQFDQNEYICSGTNFEGVNLYATYNQSNNEIKIYNANHEIVKSLIYSNGQSLYRVFIFGLSKDVFNSNNAIEFIIQSFNDKGGVKYELIDDQNNVIQEFQGAAIIRTIGNKNYIAESNYEQNQSIYSQTDKLYLINGKFRKIVY